MKQGPHPLEPSLCPVGTEARGLGILLWTQPSYPVCFPEWGAQKSKPGWPGAQQEQRRQGGLWYGACARRPML